MTLLRCFKSFQVVFRTRIMSRVSLRTSITSGNEGPLQTFWEAIPFSRSKAPSPSSPTWHGPNNPPNQPHRRLPSRGLSKQSSWKRCSQGVVAITPSWESMPCPKEWHSITKWKKWSTPSFHDPSRVHAKEAWIWIEWNTFCFKTQHQHYFCDCPLHTGILNAVLMKSFLNFTEWIKTE